MHGFFVILVILSVFFVTSCDLGGASGAGGTGQRFASDLRGTWRTHDEGIYSGTLEISFDRITITGYGFGQTPENGDDNKRPFRSFLKNIPLRGYSEEERIERRLIGVIFIEDAGIIQEGIPYLYWSDNLPNFTRVEFLRFDFGDRLETLRKVN
jgi:hypothetical protein